MTNFYPYKQALRPVLLLFVFLLPLLAFSQEDKKENKKEGGITTNALPPDDGGGTPSYCNAITLQLVSQDCNKAILRAYPPLGCTFTYVLNGPEYQYAGE